MWTACGLQSVATTNATAMQCINPITFSQGDITTFQWILQSPICVPLNWLNRQIASDLIYQTFDFQMKWRILPWNLQTWARLFKRVSVKRVLSLWSTYIHLTHTSSLSLMDHCILLGVICSHKWLDMAKPSSLKKRRSCILKTSIWKQKITRQCNKISEACSYTSRVPDLTMLFDAVRQDRGVYNQSILSIIIQITVWSLSHNQSIHMVSSSIGLHNKTITTFCIGTWCTPSHIITNSIVPVASH